MGLASRACLCVHSAQLRLLLTPALAAVPHPSTSPHLAPSRPSSALPACLATYRVPVSHTPRREQNIARRNSLLTHTSAALRQLQHQLDAVDAFVTHHFQGPWESVGLKDAGRHWLDTVARCVCVCRMCVGVGWWVRVVVTLSGFVFLTTMTLLLACLLSDCLSCVSHLPSFLACV